MSRLSDLLRQASKADPQLAQDLEVEFQALMKRRSFGLVFERHQPEAVELPGHPVKRGDKVHVLPPRGSTKKGDGRLWRVMKLEGQGNDRRAHLREMDAVEPQEQIIPTADLIVVAEFRDTIYPGLVETGRVERGGDKPFHTVINAENFHALETLTYTHRHRVDAIYIDPPYNTGARDWKYNNDYVEEDDTYRHSKWLAMMERRLKISKELLKPDNSVLILTIDEKEYLRVGLLIEQLFPESQIQMVSSVINPKGTGRAYEFSRTNEFIFFVRFGYSKVIPSQKISNEGQEVVWETMRRRNLASLRGRKGKGACGPNQFFPIFVNDDTGSIVGRGSPIQPDVDRRSIVAPSGCVPVFPVREDGTEMNWEYTPETFDTHFNNGFIRANGRKTGQPQEYIIQHLPNKTRQEIEDGVAVVSGHRSDGSIIAEYATSSMRAPTTQWEFKSHSAEHGGTGVLKSLIESRKFPFPKSLYAVEDALRYFVKDNPLAIILDFFSGSGTTAHAVIRLNRQDGGKRQAILITNNEVAAEEHKRLREAGLRPGDPEWEQWGICDYITKPRIRAAITGQTPDGEPIKGEYKFTDEFPMSEGFEENAAFFTLTYESPRMVAHHRAFQRIAPLLWMRAGSQGQIIESLGEQGWAVSDCYGVLENMDETAAFIAAIGASASVRTAFLVTDDDSAFQSACRDLPATVRPVQLYESYLTNFEINSGRLD